MRLFKFIKPFLLVWGAISFAAFIAFAILGSYNLVFANHNKDDSATLNDVRFVLNSCKLGDKHIEKVVHSHVSARSFSGDHLDAFAIKISKIEMTELTSNTNDASGQWYRGDQLPQVVNDALKFVTACHQEIPWFPNEQELRSSEFYAYPWSIHYYGINPSAAELIFISPSDKMIFYFESKI